MYNLPVFKEPDPSVIRSFMKQHPFAVLAGCDNTLKPVATQVPLFIDEREGRLFLSGHIMQHTDHHKAFVQNPQVLAIFSGPHTYVSASWYQNKQQGSTWNYLTVQASGVLRFLDESSLRDILQRTTDHFENDPDSGANFKDLPADYIDRLMKAIVGFEIEVERLEHVFKLSQNRDEKSYDNIAAHLQQHQGDGKSIGDLMSERREKVFPDAQNKK